MVLVVCGCGCARVCKVSVQEKRRETRASRERENRVAETEKKGRQRKRERRKRGTRGIEEKIKGKLMKNPKKTSILTKSPFLPLTDTIHYTFKKDFSLKVNSTGIFLLSLPKLKR